MPCTAARHVVTHASALWRPKLARRSSRVLPQSPALSTAPTQVSACAPTAQGGPRLPCLGASLSSPAAGLWLSLRLVISARGDPCIARPACESMPSTVRRACRVTDCNHGLHVLARHDCEARHRARLSIIQHVCMGLLQDRHRWNRLMRTRSRLLWRRLAVMVFQGFCRQSINVMRACTLSASAAALRASAAVTNRRACVRTSKAKGQCWPACNQA